MLLVSSEASEDFDAALERFICGGEADAKMRIAGAENIARDNQ